jgi:uncharacterized protein (DUF1697 family)
VPRYVVLLRGVNLGSRNRVPMPALRDALGVAGFGDVRTHLQSGNVVLSSRKAADRVARECEREIEGGFGLRIDVVVRTRAELAKVVRCNPLGAVAEDPKRYQVTFLAAKLPQAVVRELEAAAVVPEQLAVVGREVYAWHPAGIARSKLWALIASRKLGVVATSRNWATVEALFELADS